MAKDIEALMGDALDAAVNEAIEEIDGDTFDEVIGDDDGEDADAGDEASGETADNPEIEGQDDSEDEAADGDAENETEGFSWDGKPESLNGDAKAIYDVLYGTMRKGVESWMSERATAWGRQKQEYEKRLADMEVYVREQQQLASAPKPPQRPGDGATQDDWDAYFAGIAKHAAWEQTRELQKQQQAKPAANDQQAAMVEAQVRAKTIESLPDYTDDIGVKMVELAEADEFWADAFRTDRGAMKLFSVAKLQIEADRNKKAAAQAKSADIRHKAGASKRSVSKPVVRSKAPAPARDWAKMTLDDVVDAALDEAIGEVG